jgi:hypothetical protein
MPRPLALALCFIVSLSTGITASATLASKGKHTAKHATKTAHHRSAHPHITVRRKHGLGYLPGFGPKGVYAERPRERLYGQPYSATGYSATGYSLPPFYTWDGDRYYPGRPRFSGSRWNGGSFGPCYTQTPIGPMWNCGK